jgi:hypothetical protein
MAVGYLKQIALGTYIIVDTGNGARVGFIMCEIKGIHDFGDRGNWGHDPILRNRDRVPNFCTGRMFDFPLSP